MEASGMSNMNLCLKGGCWEPLMMSTTNIRYQHLYNPVAVEQNIPASVSECFQPDFARVLGDVQALRFKKGLP
ncbi:hypothetical protein B0H34DRAFT_67848 [Crassisporium funariophilum]|nr:hypothetical protein B0H34DRAFT_67848 [Crassisporium funariophilum]